MDNNIDKSFKPTPQWMSEKYDELNKRLFGGELGWCDFNIFTSGEGSQGNVLGFFRIGNKHIRGERRSRRMFVDNSYGREYVNRSNFYDLCYPSIALNGNYSGTEHAFLNVLVHEMCHYYTYMGGLMPRQAHGNEFRSIAEYVSNKSNGEFTIERIATAEQMTEFQLSAAM